MPIRKRNFIIITLIIIIIIIIIISINKEMLKNIKYSVKVMLYEEPITEENIINNRFFDINNDGTHALETTKGINEAIRYANENNIKQIKLEKGIYLIDGTSKLDSTRAEEKGIILSSNISLDLNGSTLKHIQNDKTNYSVFTIIGEGNIEIKNGIIYGDRENHIDQENKANDKGFGIDIRGGNDIIIDNLEVCNFTGDGILIRELDDGKKIYNSKNINIQNCNIFQNRRQGMSIVSAENVKIESNEIHDIEGKNPQACIDIETDGWSFQENDNIVISNNKLYASKSNLAIQIYNKRSKRIKIQNNEVQGRILLCNIEDYALIENNTIKDGGIVSNKNYYSDKNEFLIEKLIIKNNEFKSGKIEVVETNNLIFQYNNVEGTSIYVEPRNVVLEENKSDNGIVFQSMNENVGEKLIIYYLNNEFENIEANFEYVELETNPNKVKEIIEIMMSGVE